MSQGELKKKEKQQFPLNHSTCCHLSRVMSSARCVTGFRTPWTVRCKVSPKRRKPPRLKKRASQQVKWTFMEFTCVSFTLYVALQRENIRAFLPVYVSRQTKFCDDLESPLAQSDAVLRPDAHVSPVKPLHAGGAGRAAVHLGTFCAPRSAECPLETAGRRAASSVISKRATTRSDWSHASPPPFFSSFLSPLEFEEWSRGGLLSPTLPTPNRSGLMLLFWGLVTRWSGSVPLCLTAK